MNRKEFLRNSSGAVGGILIAKNLFPSMKTQPLYGHNGMQYSLNTNWADLNKTIYPVNDCHEMVQDSKGRILLLTNETKNNVLIFNKDGKLTGDWGHDFPGAHGLTLHDENGTEFLYITDTANHQVYKTTMDGDILLTISAPADAGIYKKPQEFVPTETVIDGNGDIFIADGYGLQYILQYDSKGNLKHFFGGRGEGDEHLDNAHGICFDTRNKDQTLLITDRTRNCFKVFSKSGKLLDKIELPGACVCRPVIKGDYLYAAVLRSPDLNAPGTGFVTIIDKQNKVVSNIGGSKPEYVAGKLQPMRQEEKIFVHPHDVCVDDDLNIYVAQWLSNKVYPYKLTRA
jgi:peptidylamidoglycolate lyase